MKQGVFLERDGILNLVRVERQHQVSPLTLEDFKINQDAVPLLKKLKAAGLVDTDHLIADCKSGVSGAGRKAELNLTFSEAADNFAAYGVNGHRHAPGGDRDNQ